nr:ribosome maturation factor RimP [Pyrinomonadaceae bacterium]
MSGASLEERVRQIAAGAAVDRNLEIVHVEVARNGRSLIVRIFIDKPGGVTHGDCA